MEDKVNNAIVGAIMAALKWLGRNTVRLTGRVFKSGAKKAHENTKSYQLSSVKKLVKKQPNAGLYETNDGLSKEEFNYIKKQLNKSHQYFTASKEIGEDGKEKYTISTTKGNKDLVDYLQSEYLKNKQQSGKVKKGIGSIGKRRSLDKTFKTAEIGMKRQEQERAAKQHEVQKHKEIKKEDLTR